jgi:hypothetical protein
MGVIHSTIPAQIISDPNIVPRVLQAHGNQDDPLVVAEWEEIWTVLQAECEVERDGESLSKGMWKRTLAGMSVQ